GHMSAMRELVDPAPTAYNVYEYEGPLDFSASLVEGLNSDAVEAPRSLTADSLLIYLQSRLAHLDTRVNEIFGKQQRLQHVHDELMEIQKDLDNLDEENGGTNSDYQA